MKIHRYYILSIISLVLIFSANNIHAQFSAYHGIVFPYDNLNKSMNSIGDITYVLFDHSANVQINPVGTIFIEHPQISISLNHDISRYYITQHQIYYDDTYKSKTLSTKQNIYPGFLSAALPMNLLKRKSVFALTINKIDTPEHEVWFINNISDLDYHHQRKGNVWNLATGISCNLLSPIDIGISFSKFFGSWDFFDESASEFLYGKGAFQYDGGIFNFGFSMRFGKISMCTIFHTPCILMKAKNFQLQRGKTNIERYNIQQHFNGGFKSGIGLHWNDKLSLSIGYRYQGKISIKNEMKRRNVNYKLDEDYSSSHRVSVAGEYIINFKNNNIPLSLAYSVNLIPKTNERFPETFIEYFYRHYVSTYTDTDRHYFGYQYFSIDSNTRISHQIAFGLSYPRDSFTFYFTSQLNINAINVFNTNARFLSSKYWPGESFRAKKLTLILNFGVSYVFKII